MGNEQNITRSEVESMISAAISYVLGSGAGAKGPGYASGLKHPPAFSGPTGYGENQAEVTGIAMAHKVAREQANKRIEDARTAPNATPSSAAPPPAAATPAQKHVEMGNGQRQISDPIGGHKTAGATGGLGRAYSGAGQEKKPPSPEVMQAVSKTAEGMAKTFVTEEQVKAMLSGIHPAILNQCRAGVQHNQGGTGDSYLKIPTCNSPYTVAVWGKGGGQGGTDYDYLFVGTKKVTPPAKTSNFLKIMLDGSGASWVVAMPTTQDSDSVTIDVTKNRIYLSGEFGGG